MPNACSAAKTKSTSPVIQTEAAALSPVFTILTLTNDCGQGNGRAVPVKSGGTHPGPGRLTLTEMMYTQSRAGNQGPGGRQGRREMGSGKAMNNYPLHMNIKIQLPINL